MSKKKASRRTVRRSRPPTLPPQQPGQPQLTAEQLRLHPFIVERSERQQYRDLLREVISELQSAHSLEVQALRHATGDPEATLDPVNEAEAKQLLEEANQRLIDAQWALLESMDELACAANPDREEARIVLAPPAELPAEFEK